MLPRIADGDRGLLLNNFKVCIITSRRCPRRPPYHPSFTVSCSPPILMAEYSSIWDSTPTASQFSQLPDDDFLALLARQFPQPVSHQPNQSEDTHDASVNPQSIIQHPPPAISPPSDDSSPSPLSNNTDPASRRQSQSTFSRPVDNATHGDETPILKRKASDDDLEEGPSSKNKHTSP